jgi:hypothetical protein
MCTGTRGLTEILGTLAPHVWKGDRVRHLGPATTLVNIRLLLEHASTVAQYARVSVLRLRECVYYLLGLLPTWSCIPSTRHRLLQTQTLLHTLRRCIAPHSHAFTLALYICARTHRSTNSDTHSLLPAQPDSILRASLSTSSAIRF